MDKVETKGLKMETFKVTIHYGRKLVSGWSDIRGFYNVAAKDDGKARAKAVAAFKSANKGENVRLKYCEIEALGPFLG